MTFYGYRRQLDLSRVAWLWARHTGVSRYPVVRAWIAGQKPGDGWHKSFATEVARPYPFTT